MSPRSISYLTSAGLSFERIVVPGGVHTVDDVQRACGCTRAQVIKALLFVGVVPVVALVPGDMRVDVGKLKLLRNDDSLRMAKSDEVASITGYDVGTVSPFGIRGAVELLADEAVESLTFLIMGSGKGDTLLRMTAAEFRNAFTGSFVALAR